MMMMAMYGTVGSCAIKKQQQIYFNFFEYHTFKTFPTAMKICLCVMILKL